jgi:N-acetyl-gamma-glutamyl-phosphate reductase
MIKVGIVGGTGYTGVELLRLLVRHPQVNLHCITSRKEAGKPVADLFPNLRGHVSLCYADPAEADLAGCDLVFYATPNGTAMQSVPDLLAQGVKVIDLAADFRLRDPAVWQQWYGMPHHCPELLQDAVYGLPEMNRAAIRQARLVANPGCYATAVQLALLPLLEADIIDCERIIADCKSGVSGAGRGAEVGSLLAEAGDSFKAYKVSGHRHLPEIQQSLQAATGKAIGLTFVPHLLPMIRGIHATVYAPVTASDAEVQALYENRYRDECFVDVMPPGAQPETRSVRGSNMYRLALYRPQGADTLVVLGVLDNLVKGAAGQALQNMNLMYNWPETTGLESVALLP